MDESTDLALLNLRGLIVFQPVDLGDSDTFAVGEDAIAMGFPLGDVLQGSPTTTRGILSAKRTSKSGVKLLQIDAAINPGSSGGPLFDREGRVVGVNTSKLFESGDGRPVEGIGLAIAINEVRDRLDSLGQGWKCLSAKSGEDDDGSYVYAETRRFLRLRQRWTMAQLRVTNRRLRRVLGQGLIYATV